MLQAPFVSLRGLKLLAALCVAVLLLAPLQATAATAASGQATEPAQQQQPLIAAHRGASGYAPENTMAAFELADRMGADLLELDVRMSKDGELVVIHDGTVDRTTKYSGAVATYTLSQLQAMDAGSYYRKRFAGERIPALEQVLSRFYGRIGLLIELKDPHLYPGIEEKVAEAVRRHELLRLLEQLEVGGIDGSRAPKVIIQSFDAASMRTMHRLLPDIPIAVLIGGDQLPLSEALLGRLSVFTSSLHCSYSGLNAAIVRQLHRRNQFVMAWTLRNKADMERMRRLGVDGLITDNPNSGWN
jgi:glycerophosphoryl diester phosphodiesterase